MKDWHSLHNSAKEIEMTIQQLVSYLERNNFQGWEPYDIPATRFNMPALVRITLTQAFRLCPISFHRFFIEKKLHAKAATLFARSFLMLYDLTKEPGYYQQAIYFLDWIENHRSLQSRHFSIGTQFQLNMKNYRAKPGTPAPLLTCFAIEAFISAYEISGDNKYLELANSGVQYFLEELPQKKIASDQSYFIYHPNNPKFIPNLPAVISGTLSRFYSISTSPELLNIIKNNLNYVVKFQRDDGSWLYQPDFDYTDSFHTAFILEALAKYQQYVGDERFEGNLSKGLTFYINTFFNRRGRPLHKKRFGLPDNADSLLTKLDLRDIAMGMVLCKNLSSTGRYPINRGIELFNWTMHNFRSKQGYFYCQQLPVYTVKSPYLSMQAWMLYALCILLKTIKSYQSNR